MKTFFNRNSILLSCLFWGILLLTPTLQAKAQDFSGTWTVDLVNGDTGEHSAQSWIINQLFIQGVPVIKGSGTDLTNNWKIQATYSADQFAMVYLFDELPDYLITLQGTFTDTEAISGNWGDSSAHFGTWSAARIALPLTPVTPKTIIKDAPNVIVDETTNSATLFLEKFSVSGVKAKLIAKAKAKTTLQYYVEISRTKDALGKTVKNELIKKTTKKNQLALKNLKTGEYSARYRVEILTKKDGKEVITGRTKFSPPAAFDLN